MPTLAEIQAKRNKGAAAKVAPFPSTPEPVKEADKPAQGFAADFNADADPTTSQAAEFGGMQSSLDSPDSAARAAEAAALLETNNTEVAEIAVNRLKRDNTVKTYYFRMHKAKASIIYDPNVSVNERINFANYRYKTDEPAKANWLRTRYKHACWEVTEAEYVESLSLSAQQAKPAEGKIVDAGTKE